MGISKVTIVKLYTLTVCYLRCIYESILVYFLFGESAPQAIGKTRKNYTFPVVESEEAKSKISQIK